MTDFAKILRLEDGTQALFYFEPDGDEQFLHQVFSFDSIQVDVKLGGLRFAEERQQGFLDDMTEEKAAGLKDSLALKFGLD
ncbi:hypothetical protein [Pseudomonas sp.]|uniref:hypothetical protein n=1 Tax=Pseudomonas sp. TaxID=306 RepID=UPI003D13209F